MASRNAGPNLSREQRRYKDTGGLSENNGSLGFWPAFLDQSTHAIHLSRTADGQPAPYHCLAGLPDSLVVARDPSGRVTAVRSYVVSGFVRDGKFYTRAEAAASVARGGRRAAPRPAVEPGPPKARPKALEMLEDAHNSWANMVLESSLMTLRVGWSIACLPLNLASSWNSLNSAIPPCGNDARRDKASGEPDAD